MNKFIKISIALVVALVLLFTALYLKKTQSEKPGTQNSVVTIDKAIADKTYQTKTEAWEAYANEKETFYSRQAGSFDKALDISKNVEPEAAKPTPAAQSAMNSAQEAQFDAAYDEITQNVRSIYSEQSGDNTSTAGSAATIQLQSAAPDQQVIIETPEERRRRSMRQNWGMNSSGEAPNAEVTHASMFRAVIHGTQLVKGGQTALFRTKEPLQYGNMTVPANTLLAGFAQISENRLTIKINSVRLGHEVFALPLEVYGSDGIAGIPLNYDEVGQITNSETSSAALRETSSAMSSYGGTVGRVVGSVVSGIGNQVRNSKNVEIKLIDNQTVILKIAER